MDTGHFVQPVGGAKAEPLFTVVRLDTVRVPVEVPEADAGLVHKGQKTTVRVPALNNRDYSDKVTVTRARTFWPRRSARRPAVLALRGTLSLSVAR